MGRHQIIIQTNIPNAKVNTYNTLSRFLEELYSLLSPSSAEKGLEEHNKNKEIFISHALNDLKANKVYKLPLQKYWCISDRILKEITFLLSNYNTNILEPVNKKLSDSNKREIQIKVEDSDIIINIKYKEDRLSNQNKPTDFFVCEYMYLKTRECRERNLDFCLSFKTVKRLLNIKNCQVTKVPFVKVSNSPNRPTVDRIDNSKGYIEGNVAVVTHAYNQMKGNLSIEFIQQTYEFLKKKKLLK